MWGRGGDYVERGINTFMYTYIHTHINVYICIHILTYICMHGTPHILVGARLCREASLRPVLGGDQALVLEERPNGIQLLA